LKSDLLRGWIGNSRVEIRYGLPEEKTKGENLKT